MHDHLAMLAHLGVRVVIADWLPEPAILLPDYGVGLIDGGLDEAERCEALLDLLDLTLDEIASMSP